MGNENLDEIEITPEMIEAGICALCDSDFVLDQQSEIVARIFKAMLAVSSKTAAAALLGDEEPQART